MADWVDSYPVVVSPFIEPTEIDRLFREYHEGRISRSYMLGLFGMDEEAFDGAVPNREGLQRDESAGEGRARGTGDGVRARSP